VDSLRHASIVIALIVGSAAAGYPQKSTASSEVVTPDFRVEVRGDIVADFNARVSTYIELRRELEKGLPALTATDDPAEIRGAVHALAKRIRVARAEATEGDIFTPPISAEFKGVLRVEVHANTCAAIMDDNPGASSHHINASYPEGQPLSTVPPNVLAVLPRLPDDLEYRFMRRHLVLVDGRARVILDRIRYAIHCHLTR
jgi:hypothetical protein